MYHPYELWEDWWHGMYYATVDGDAAVLTEQCRDLLNNPEALRIAMTDVINQWKYAAEQNMSCRGRNRQAWLGQSACCLRFGAPDYITKQGWRMLTQDAQDRANSVADDVTAIWEARYAQA